MKTLKTFLLVLLHLICTLTVQVFLLRRVLLEQEPLLRCVLFSLTACVLDLVLGRLLTKGKAASHWGWTLLHFWDLFLMIPVLLLAFLGLASGGEGSAFGAAVICLELLLIVERSVCYVLGRGTEAS